MTESTPLEMSLVEAVRYRRKAEEQDRKAAQAASPQWELYHQKQAANERLLEEYHLGEARDYAALLIDGGSK